MNRNLANISIEQRNCYGTNNKKLFQNKKEKPYKIIRNMLIKIMQRIKDNRKWNNLLIL